MSYIDTKYVNLLSSNLDQFKRQGNGVWNFRCPFCGDSKKSPTKARGYVFTTPNGSLIYKCQNCGKSTSVQSLIKKVSPMLYTEYMKEKLFEKYDDTLSEDVFKPEVKKVEEPLVDKKFSQLTSISKLSSNHPCRRFVEKRKIPSKWFDDLFYVDKFYAWTNKFIPQKFSEKSLHYDDGRLIIPLISKEKKIFGYQGRMIKDTIDSKAQKYYTIILDESQPKIFGLDRVDMDRTFYVFEGPIDSMFLPNAVAICGGDLYSLRNKNAVYVFDNERRHKDTCKKIEKAIYLGCKVVIWPTSLVQKDVNEMIEDGMTEQYVKSIIDDNTYSDLEAELKFAEWRKSKR